MRYRDETVDEICSLSHTMAPVHIAVPIRGWLVVHSIEVNQLHEETIICSEAANSA